MASDGVGTDHCRVIPLEADSSYLSRIEFWRHYFAYETSARLLEPHSRVLEVGTGEGYGSARLAQRCRMVVASDTSAIALHHTCNKYPELAVCQLNAVHLPFAHASFDGLVAFQVIEHLREAEQALFEVCRVLHPEGVFIMTTPNARYRLLPLQKPWNPYHVREYTSLSLYRLLRRFFSRVDLHGVAATPEIMELEKTRVHQNPFRVWGRSSLSVVRRLPGWGRSGSDTYDRLRDLIYPAGRSMTLDSPGADVVSLDSFHLTSEPAAGLDLLAVARLPKYAAKEWGMPRLHGERKW